jgi:peroxiredoxin Q/BCP
MPSRSPARPAPPDPVRPPDTSPSGQDPKVSPARTTPKVGDPAPHFDLPGDDGQRHSLAALRGRRFALFFYPRDSTPGCTTEACDFRDRHAALLSAGVQVLGVSGDDLKSHAKFRGKHALPFPLLSDAGNAVARAYGVFGEKTLYGRVSQGIIRSTFLVGPDGRIEAAWSPVKVNGHAEAVLQSVVARGA